MQQPIAPTVAHQATHVASARQLVISQGNQTEVTLFQLNNDSGTSLTIAWIDFNGRVTNNGAHIQPGQPWIISNGAKTWESHWYAVSKPGGFVCSIAVRQNTIVNFSQLTGCN
jgi:hypothetical protein